MALLCSARKAVEQAKKKIKQQKSIIRKLEQQKVNGGQDECTGESLRDTFLVALLVLSAGHVT